MDGYAVRADDTPGPAAGRLPDRRRRAGRAAARGRARRWRSPPAAPCPREPTRSSRSSLLSNRTTNVEVPAPVDARRQRPADRAATSAPATSCSPPARGSARPRSARSPPPASPSCLSRRRPKVVVLSTGHRAARARRAARAGADLRVERRRCSRRRSTPPVREVERIGPVADDEEEHRRALERGLEADVLVSSGGVSVGPHDLVRRILAELGVEEDFWGVAVRPGKPLAFGVRGRDARLRAARATRSRRSSGSSSSCGRRCSRSRARPIRSPAYEIARLAAAAAPERCARRARPRPHAARRRRDGARAAHRPGVAHDRPRRRRPTRSCSCPRRGRAGSPGSASATSRCA